MPAGRKGIMPIVLKPASQAIRQDIMEQHTLLSCRKVRTELVETVCAGFTIKRLLPTDLWKVSPTVRSAVAGQFDSIALPLEWSKATISTGESLRIYLSKYLVPAWPALADVWDSLLLVPDEQALYGRGE